MTWAAFEQYALDRYKAYLYLAVAHHLNTPVLEALSVTNTFRRERFFLNAFIRELDVFLHDHGWDGGADDSDAEMGARQAYKWNGFYDLGNSIVDISEDYSVHVRLFLGDQIPIRYVWGPMYAITRNDIPITRDQLLEMIAVDLKV